MFLGLVFYLSPHIIDGGFKCYATHFLLKKYPQMNILNLRNYAWSLLKIPVNRLNIL